MLKLVCPILLSAAALIAGTKIADAPAGDVTVPEHALIRQAPRTESLLFARKAHRGDIRQILR